MRVSVQWLREWVELPLSTQELADALTMAGLEVDAVEPAAPPFSNVVVAAVVECHPHPEADNLQCCRVDVGSEQLAVVCAAPNVRPGLRAPLARDGAELPDGRRVQSTTVRGVPSTGMLCSAAELGLSDDHGGVLELDVTLPLGADLREALALDDTVLEIDLTPNRADCLGMVGVARDVAAITGAAFRPGAPAQIAATCGDTIEVRLEAPADCPRYCGRVVRDVNAAAPSPVWLRERLRRAGIRSVSALVDITNYVLLEQGQPMHAFDLNRLAPPIVVRRAKVGESLELLAGDERVKLDDDVLAIADSNGPIAFAGVMGGATTAVSTSTTDLFLEAAFFAPTAIAGRARRFGLHTDSSHRFERGVDFDATRRACERATELVVTICGGRPGPITDTVEPGALPDRPPIELRRERLQSLLGWEIEAERVGTMLERLGTRPESTAAGWRIVPPSWRFDLEREVDLIEEVARLYGYNAVPERPLSAPLHVATAPEEQQPVDSIRQTLVERGYFEAITYSFVDAQLQTRLDPTGVPLTLANPLSSELAVMRTTLWPGLLMAVQHNQHRQHERVRLFEAGRSFHGPLEELAQTQRLAGVCVGPLLSEQWGEGRRDVDFFDVKADLEALFACAGAAERLRFCAASHPALHPGQSARIKRNGRPIGWLGALHPGHTAAFELNGTPILFEVELAAVESIDLPEFRAISRYPAIRRDLAVVVDESVSVADLLAATKEAAGPIATDVVLFDIYRGKGVADSAKSVAMGLILQDATRTLTDTDVEQVVAQVVECLRSEYRATLRGK